MYKKTNENTQEVKKWTFFNIDWTKGMLKICSLFCLKLKGLYSLAPYTRRGGGGGRHEQVYTRVDSEGQNKFPSPCPSWGSNPGSSDLNSDGTNRWATSPLSTFGRFCRSVEVAKKNWVGLWVLAHPASLLKEINESKSPAGPCRADACTLGLRWPKWRGVLC